MYSELRRLYFKWISQLVCDSRYPRPGKSYNYLFQYLFETSFVPVLTMDENRAKDGLDLRYRFSYETAYENSLVQLAFSDKPCSVLEMMAALALRIEENIMYDPRFGDRVPIWFWIMIDNLGLTKMDDDNFDEIECEAIIHTFMNRNYEPDGRGGLFAFNCTRDLRKVEIWNQACWFLDTIP